MELLLTEWIFSSLRKTSEFPHLMWEIIWEEINLCITWFAVIIKSEVGYLWWTFSSTREKSCHFYGKNRISVLHIALGFKQHKWTEQKHKQDKRIHGTALWKHFLHQSRYLYLKCESARENFDTDFQRHCILFHICCLHILNCHICTQHLCIHSGNLECILPSHWPSQHHE